MFDNNMRKRLIKTLIRNYYELEKNALYHQASHETFERLEAEMQKLMTANEYETFFDCNEFDGQYWSDV